MATTLTSLLILLHVLTISALELTSEKVLPQKRPHLTGCLSANMETFRCRWDVGAPQNVSEPDVPRLFYINRAATRAFPKEWSECPHYSRGGECFFNENHTSIWTSYSIQLRSQNQSILYDEDFFHVEDIVQPDPPVGLNWTLLNMSLTTAHFDVMVSWDPPQSADVDMGWMTLQYEVQHQEAKSSLWKVNLQRSTQSSLYGLVTNVDHEVRVRCRMLGSKHFGEFSDSVFIHVPSIVSQFPYAVTFSFAALTLVAILILLIVTQQQKLMFILLPPVPGPKIRGIDFDRIKRGEMELMSILGNHPELRAELYSEDTWVEFIDLDIVEDKLTDMDTDFLVDRPLSSNCFPLSIGFRDGSSHASYCDPDLASDPEAYHPFLLNHSPSQGPVESSSLVVPCREDIYTQVGEVRLTGHVLLTPEEQAEMARTTRKDTEDEGVVERGKENAKQEFQLMFLNAAKGGYTTEQEAGKMSPRLPTEESSEPGQREDLSNVPSQTFGEFQRQYIVLDMSPMSPLPSSAVYTVLDDVARQNSIVLTPNPTPAPQLITPKAMPSPEGYLTFELLKDITQ